MIHFDFDVAPEEPDRDEWVEKLKADAATYGCTVRRIKWFGPAGGNPQVFVDAPNEAYASAFVARTYGIDTKNRRDMEAYVDPVMDAILGGSWEESDLPAEGRRK